MCSNLMEDGVEVEIMLIPSHVGFEGNEIVDELARHATLSGAVFDTPLPLVDYQGLARSVLQRECRESGTLLTGRFAHSIIPRVSLRLWFEGQRENRKFVSTGSRLMSGHCAARSHLSRFRIVEEVMCVCFKDYETMDNGPLDMVLRKILYQLMHSLH
jgi:hypothetical protein